MAAKNLLLHATGAFPAKHQLVFAGKALVLAPTTQYSGTNIAMSLSWCVCV